MKLRLDCLFTDLSQHFGIYFGGLRTQDLYSSTWERGDLK